MTRHFGPTKNIGTFYPPQRILMGPGPSDTHPRVLAAMARPTLGHLDPVFTDMMEGAGAGGGRNQGECKGRFNPLDEWNWLMLVSAM